MEYITTDTELTLVANAIRGVYETTQQYEYVSGFVEAINGMTTIEKVFPVGSFWATRNIESTPVSVLGIGTWKRLAEAPIQKTWNDLKSSTWNDMKKYTWNYVKGVTNKVYVWERIA